MEVHASGESPQSTRGLGSGSGPPCTLQGLAGGGGGPAAAAKTDQTPPHAAAGDCHSETAGPGISVGSSDGALVGRPAAAGACREDGRGVVRRESSVSLPPRRSLARVAGEATGRGVEAAGRQAQPALGCTAGEGSTAQSPRTSAECSSANPVRSTAGGVQAPTNSAGNSPGSGDSLPMVLLGEYLPDANSGVGGSPSSECGSELCIAFNQCS